MRKAIVEGQFYPLRKVELEGEVKKLLGFGKRDEMIKAVIVPHAGYVFSGKIAGKVFSIIPQKKEFFLLGVNHSGIGPKASLSFENFETPLGEIKNNWETGEKLFQELSKERIDVAVNEEVHRYEHSLEVQLPFLQVLFHDFRIVPIIFRDLSYEECSKIAESLSKTARDELFIVSSDTTHYGKNYRFVPFEEAEKNFEKYDGEIIEEIIKLDGKSFYEKAKKSTICGIYAITILIELAKIRGWKPRMVDYATSAEMTKDWSNVVGYAGIAFSS